MTAQLALFQSVVDRPAEKRETAGPRPPTASAVDGPTEKPLTTKARMKHLREELRFAQMQVRLDLSGLERSKTKARRIAAEMRMLCQIS